MITQGMMIAHRYEIIGKIGAGGMSDVYKAKDTTLGRYVAIKVLKSEFSEDLLKDKIMKIQNYKPKSPYKKCINQKKI